MIAPTTVGPDTRSQVLARAVEPLLGAARAGVRGLGARPLPPAPVRRGVTALPESVPAVRHYNDSPALCCLVLLLEIAVVLALTAWFMRRKDVATR